MKYALVAHSCTLITSCLCMSFLAKQNLYIIPGYVLSVLLMWQPYACFIYTCFIAFVGYNVSGTFATNAGFNICFVSFYDTLTNVLTLSKYDKYVSWLALLGIIVYIWYVRLQTFEIPTYIANICAAGNVLLWGCAKYVYVKMLPHTDKTYREIDITKNNRRQVNWGMTIVGLGFSLLTSPENNYTPFNNTLNFYSISVTALMLLLLKTMYNKIASHWLINVYMAICALTNAAEHIYDFQYITRNAKQIVEVTKYVLLIPTIEHTLVYAQSPNPLRMFQVVCLTLAEFYVPLTMWYKCAVILILGVYGSYLSRIHYSVYKEDKEYEICTQALIL